MRKLSKQRGPRVEKLIQMWALFPSHCLLASLTLRHEDGGDAFLRNVHELLPYYTPFYPPQKRALFGEVGD
jgi:hypothetical protein